MKSYIGFYVVLLLFSLVACDWDSAGGGGSQPNTLPGLPPDPGEAGKATLAGIDSDNDGVRDDLQRYIAIEYQNSEKTRRVLTDMAKANQAFLLNFGNKNKTLEVIGEQHKAINCLWYIDPDTASNKYKKLKIETLNTEERIRAWIKADSHLGGMTFRLPDDAKAQCNFDPDQLKN